jgi:hypothetical protein
MSEGASSFSYGRRPLRHEYKLTRFYLQHTSCVHTPVGNLCTLNIGVFFRKVAYTWYDVTWFVEWMGFT